MLRKYTPLLLSICLVILLCVLTACDSTEADKGLLLGTWEGDNDLTLEFRQFTSSDDSSWKNSGADPQDGIVIIIPKEQAPDGMIGTYRLTEKGLLIFSIRTNYSPLGPDSKMDMQWVYAFESISEDQLVLKFVFSEDDSVDTYQRISAP